MFSSKFTPNATLLVTWTKKDGESRTLMARVPSDYSSEEAVKTGYGLVLCLETGGYKKVKLDSIVSVNTIKAVKPHNRVLQASEGVGGLTQPVAPQNATEGFKTAGNGIPVSRAASYSKRRNQYGTYTVKCGNRIVGMANTAVQADRLISKDKGEVK